MTDTTHYLWAFSTVTKATLQAGAYQITAFTWQTDQVTPLLCWKEPGQDGSEHPRRQRYSAMLDGSQRADGFWTGVLCFGLLTPLAMGYLDTSQFSSGTVESAAATIQVPDDNNRAWNVFTCTMYRPIPGQDFEYRDGYYVAVKYRWTAGTRL